MLSSGMFSDLAASIAVRSRALPSGSPPPCLAAMVISRISRVNSAPRRASATAFFRLICFHLLWPAIRTPRVPNLQLDPSAAPQVGYRPMTIRLRSEEHTSELQSHSDLVCRLLLEKKKKNN